MPWGLHRYQQTGDFHFVTFSCYRRKAKLSTPASRDTFEHSLEQTRRKYGLYIAGYVVMPEHVHLLLGEPASALLSTALQTLKQSVSRRLALRAPEPFWQTRYYDFNVHSERKYSEKLCYMHRNPVKRGLVSAPEDWPWSSFRHWATGAEGIVEIESPYTARRREQAPVGESGCPIQACLGGFRPQNP